MEYLDIDKTKIPYEFTVKLGDKTYTMKIKYNRNTDKLTFDLKYNGDYIFQGKKVNYGEDIFGYIYRENAPNVIVMPLDIQFNEQALTYDNFMDTVFLWVI